MKYTPEEPDFDFITPTKKEADAKRSAQGRALQALSARWGDRHRNRVNELAKELGDGLVDAGTDERLMHRLAATCTAVSEQLGRAQLQLGERLERLIDDHKGLLTVAKSLREITAVQTATMRSVQELLSTAATVRAQRRLIDHHEKRSWHADIGGGPLPPTRRSPPARREAAN